MGIKVERLGDVNVLRLAGELKSGPPTRELRDASRALVDAGERFFVLDMAGVYWLDSGAIGEVVACYKRARGNEGVVKLVLRDKAYSIFTMTQLDKIFEIYSDSEEAIASFA